MKRLTLIALIALFSLNIMAQTEEATDPGVQVTIQTPTVTDTDFEKLFDKYTAKAGEGINNLLKSVQENFTDEAEFVWDTYLMKYKITWYSCLAGLIFSVLMIITGIGLHKSHMKLGRESRHHEIDDTAQGIFALICWIVGSTLAVTFAVLCISKMSYLLIPEYHVLQDLLTILK